MLHALQEWCGNHNVVSRDIRGLKFTFKGHQEPNITLETKTKTKKEEEEEEVNFFFLPLVVF